MLKFEESAILNHTQSSPLTYHSMQWRGKELHMAQDGTITIHKLLNEDTGNFVCERLTAQSREMVITSVQMKPGDVLLLFLLVVLTEYGNINTLFPLK